MKSETRLSAKITDEGRVKVEINGTADEVLVLLEDEAVSIFKELKKQGYPDSIKVFALFFEHVTKEVFNIDFRAHL